MFYNVAFFKVAGMLHYYSNKKHDKGKHVLEDTFKKVTSGEYPLSDAGYSKLRDYLWKSYATEQENSSGHALTTKDRILIHLMLQKLEDVRNFQSHAYHDDAALVFAPDLCAHIERMHEAAIGAYSVDLAGEVAKYHSSYKRFDDHSSNYGSRGQRSFFKRWGEDHYITKEGRLFFLSFFLTRGEMTRVLQQSKGSKRNDKPEFKIKHAIYRYFTHRDAASRNHYGLRDSVLVDLPREQREQILAARQVFKAISYLNDIPYRAHDPELFPLFLKSGASVNSAMDLVRWKEENGLLPDIGAEVRMVEARSEMERFGANGRKPRMRASDPNVHPVTEVEGGLLLRRNDNERYVFTIPARHFHRCILDAMRRADQGNFFRERLEAFVKEREDFLALLGSAYEKMPQRGLAFTLKKELDEYYKFRLRGDGKLTKRMGQWLGAIDLQNESGYPEVLAKLKEQLRISPIVLNYYGLSFTTEQKPRATDRFTEFAVKYLIDHKVVPEWLWGMEHFEPETQHKLDRKTGETVKRDVLRRRITFKDHIPQKELSDSGAKDAALRSEARLAITDGHALVQLRDHERYIFRIGHRALKNLLIAHWDGEQVHHLLDKLIRDLDLVNEARRNRRTLDLSKLRLLDKNSLAESTRRAIAPLLHDGAWREQATTKALYGSVDRKGQTRPGRIDTIIRELEPFLANDPELPRMSRADRNRQIMRCYKYFEWKYPHDTQFKFLRQHEYQNMSIYHYMLWDNPKGRSLESGRYSDLLKGIIPHMPDAVKELLLKSRDLNHLLRNTAQATIELLMTWKAELCKPDLDATRFGTIMGRLGIPIGGVPKEVNPNLPIAIHPILPVRAFYRNIDSLSLSASIWKDSVATGVLADEHYRYRTYLETLSASPAQKAIRKRVIGQMNELITEDALLWKIALKYLENTNREVHDIIGHALSSGNEQGSGMKVGSLLQAVIPVRLELNLPREPSLIQELQDLKIGSITVHIMFKQLDDYLLVESRPQLLKAACQVIRRHETMQQHPDVTVVTTGIAREYSIPYGLIYQEIQRVQNQAVHWAGTLLEKEREVVLQMNDVQRDRLTAEAQAKGGLGRIDFGSVIETLVKDERLRRLIVNFRNTTLHADIPVGWTYEGREKDADFYAVLGHVPKKPKTHPSKAQE